MIRRDSKGEVGAWRELEAERLAFFTLLLRGEGDGTGRGPTKDGKVGLELVGWMVGR